jgi:hypothetical protein
MKRLVDGSAIAAWRPSPRDIAPTLRPARWQPHTLTLGPSSSDRHPATPTRASYSSGGPRSIPPRGRRVRRISENDIAQSGDSADVSVLK